MHFLKIMCGIEHIKVSSIFNENNKLVYYINGLFQLWKVLTINYKYNEYLCSNGPELNTSKEELLYIFSKLYDNYLL